MIRLLLLALAVPGAAVLAAGPRAQMTDGVRAFNAGDYTNAAAAFNAAADAATDAELDPAVPRLNQGTALLRDGRIGDAISAFSDAQRTEDLGIQADALYNHGTALLAQSAGLEQEGQLEPARKAAKEAEDLFDRTLALRPDDADAKHNIELAVRRVEELEKKIEEQRQQQQQQQQQPQEQQEQKNQPDNTGEQGENQQRDPQRDARQEPQQGQEEPPRNEAEQGQGDQGEESQEQQQEAQPREAGEMTEEEARNLLDAMKKQEQAIRDGIRVNRGAAVPVDKDW